MTQLMMHRHEVVARSVNAHLQPHIHVEIDIGSKLIVRMLAEIVPGPSCNAARRAGIAS